MRTLAEPILEVADLSSGYGPLSVVREVSFGVRAGEAVALLGANGAGKTTLLRTIAGTLSAHRGSISLLGQDVTRRSAERRSRMGLGTVPEGRALFPRLTVEDNLRIGGWGARGNREPVPLSEIYESYPMLADKRHAAASSLSGGQQQLVAIVRALRSRPSVLVLDEPSLGLSPRATAEVMEVVAEQVAAGAAVVMAEQNVSAALRVATRALVLRDGHAQEIHDIATLYDTEATRNLFL